MSTLIIIGAGWAGINAAQTARDLGLKVVLIEKDLIGGTCLNRGCIPTKCLLQSAKVYNLAKKSKNFGVNVDNPRFDFQQIQERKNKLVAQLRQGLAFMLKGIEVIQGEAKVISSSCVRAGDKEISARAIIIASGSRPMQLDSLKFDGKKVISSDEILEIKEVPASLLIIGGGVIGCEFASLFAALGTQVTIVEKLPQLLPGVDNGVARKLEIIFKKKGIKVNTNSDARSFSFSDYELVLLCVGRVANSRGLGLEEAGVRIERERVCVDEYLQTSVPGIYSAGDSTGELMLAHFAAYQGVIAAQNIAQPENPRRSANINVPSCIFTDPEIACVGLNEAQLAQQGQEAEVHKFDFLGSGMARILDETEGFLKIISDKRSGKILGASLIGPRATELISVLGLSATCQITIKQLKETIFAHPTLSESIHEAVS
jgi:dihydrolipoamide dehydrogenase